MKYKCKHVVLEIIMKLRMYSYSYSYTGNPLKPCGSVFSGGMPSSDANSQDEKDYNVFIFS